MIIVVTWFGGTLVVGFLARGGGPELFFPICIAYFLVVFWVVCPRVVSLRLAKPTFAEKYRLDIRVLLIVAIACAILGLILKAWLENK
jgi:hypothetical protein